MEHYCSCARGQLSLVLIKTRCEYSLHVLRCIFKFPVPPADLCVLALVTKSSWTWQPCLHPLGYTVCVPRADNVGPNVRSNIAGTVTQNASSISSQNDIMNPLKGSAQSGKLFFGFPLHISHIEIRGFTDPPYAYSEFRTHQNYGRPSAVSSIYP